MVLHYKYFMISMVTNFIIVIQKTHSQTVWLDVDTGKILGISPPKKTQNYGPYRTYEYNENQNIYNENYNHQNGYLQTTGNNYIKNNPKQGKVLTTEWVCRSSKTGDTMVIDNEIMVSKFPEQLQLNNNHQQQYDQNPWLNNQNNNNYNDNDYYKQPQVTTQRNWSADTTSVINNYNPSTISKLSTSFQPETLPPIVSTTKKPFPSLDNIDWTKYIESTTKVRGSTPSSLDRAINGEGVISPRRAIAD